MKFNRFIAGMTVLGGCFGAQMASAQDLTTTRLNLLGTTGIIDIPTAEVAPDGQLAVSHARFGPVTRTTLSFQLAPRISGSFRYSGTDNLTPTFDVYWDRSFDISYRLLDEGTYRPAVSIGLQDFLGTGLLSAEYIVATKSLGDRLRVTGGLGWGRLASSNPLGLTSTVRDTSFVETGGTLNSGQWFQGDVAPFAGLTYQLNDKITLLAEYSSDAYEAEVEAGIFDYSTPLNFGAEYRFSKGAALSAYALHGGEFGLSFSASINPKSTALRSGTETAPVPVLKRPSRASDPVGWSGAWVAEVGDGANIQNAVAKAMANEGLELQAMSLDVNSVELRFKNTRYGARAQALGRLARIMSRAFPPSVETFILTETLEGKPVNSAVIKRSDLERKEFRPAEEMLAATQFVDPLSFPERVYTDVEGIYPDTTWSIVPTLSASFFDPASPLSLSAGVRGQVYHEFSRGLALDGAVELLFTSGDAESEGIEVGALYPVRTSKDLYDDAIQLERLTANWYSRPAQNLYSRVTAGYLETMYAGVSGELLWKKTNSRFALGAEVNYAVQRDFEDTFGLLDYSIVTGHASAYYAFENGYHGQVDVGRYLAGDWGATFSVDREFKNGWRVGAYATLTDVPFEDFGEGSFDKGIRVTVPVDWLTGIPSIDTTEFDIQSLNRDGGARLEVEGRLYDRVRTLQGSEIEDRWGRFWR